MAGTGGHMDRSEFHGMVNIDVRDSTPDWEPFQPPVAPRGSTNVVFIVLDDVGFSALG